MFLKSFGTVLNLNLIVVMIMIKRVAAAVVPKARREIESNDAVLVVISNLII